MSISSRSDQSGQGEHGAPPADAETNPIRLLESTLLQQIPLARAISIEVQAYDGTGLSLSAPLEANTNHMQTAFGGSLYSLAVLSGWGLLFLKLKEAGLDGHIVIHRSEVLFERPVAEALRAQCRLPELPEWEQFLARFKQRGKARIELTAAIETAQGVALQHRGMYVVYR